MKSKEIFEAKDGRRFDTKEDCIAYENIIGACERSIQGHIITDSELVELRQGDYIFWTGGKLDTGYCTPPEYDIFRPDVYKIIKVNNDGATLDLYGGQYIDITIAYLFITKESQLLTAQSRKDEEFLNTLRIESEFYKDHPCMKYNAALDKIYKNSEV